MLVTINMFVGTFINQLLPFGDLWSGSISECFQCDLLKTHTKSSRKLCLFSEAVLF